MSEKQLASGAEAPLENTYDLSPYESYPYPATHPSTLAAVASIFGHKAPAIETARILELGSAAGGNIINTAINFPKATIVGIDLSDVQIKDGQKQIKELGLKNITLKTMSISDIKKDFGEFDYIICHGILSWVPQNVQEDIFRVCSENLSKNGLAIISYNTLPGWNAVNSIRHMMIYHSKDFAEPARKVQESKALLAFVNDALKGADTPYAKVVSQEAKMLSSLPDSYLRHEHLEENNRQFYFHEFMQYATRYNLQYVGDTSLASMFIGNLPKQTAEKMREITDIVRMEQYMDFIMNRRFRSTILTHKDNKLVRNVVNKSLEGIYFTAKLVANEPYSQEKAGDDSSIQFSNPQNEAQKIDTTSPILKTMLYTMADNSNYGTTVDELVESVQKKLAAKKYTNEQVKNDIESTLLRMVFAGLVGYSLSKPNFAQYALDKPKVSELVRCQVNAKQMWVTSISHERISINLVDLFLIRYMDGTRTKEQIAEEAIKHVDSGELVINRDNKPITDKQDIKSILSQYLDKALPAYAKNALFVIA